MTAMKLIALYAGLLIALSGCGLFLGPSGPPLEGTLPPEVLHGLLFPPPRYSAPLGTVSPLVTCTVFGSVITCW